MNAKPFPRLFFSNIIGLWMHSFSFLLLIRILWDAIRSWCHILRRNHITRILTFSSSNSKSYRMQRFFPTLFSSSIRCLWMQGFSFLLLIQILWNAKKCYVTIFERVIEHSIFILLPFHQYFPLTQGVFECKDFLNIISL